MYELREWLKDVKFAFEIYGYIRRSTRWEIHREERWFKIEWGGPRKSAMDRVAEHRAAQGLNTHR